MSIRSEKISSEIKKALSIHVSRLASENNLGLASVSIVKISKDLRVASIYINLLIHNPQSKEEKIKKMLNILQANNGILRSVVAKEVRMRFVPELRFFYDDTLEQIENIENMINKVRTEAPYKEHYGDESVYDTTKNIKLN